MLVVASNPRTRPCERCERDMPIDKLFCKHCKKWNAPILNQVYPLGENGAPQLAAGVQEDQTVLLSDVVADSFSFIKTGVWDKCFGGNTPADFGIRKTGVYLIGGAPGAGKSTLCLQLADCIAGSLKREIILVGAEEAGKEIKVRAERLQVKNMGLIRVVPMGSSADLGNTLMTRSPCGTFLDSLPGLVSDPNMALELCGNLKDYAVQLDMPIIIIDHVTKSDDFAGFMSLQHKVDALITFFPTGNGEMREMKTVKNRFGPAGVTCFLEMTKHGLIEGYDIDAEEEEGDEGYEDE